MGYGAAGHRDLAARLSYFYSRNAGLCANRLPHGQCRTIPATDTDGRGQQSIKDRQQFQASFSPILYSSRHSP